MKYTTNVGDYLIIWITRITGVYIAKITSSDPLVLKVTESGPFANLKGEDFIVREIETVTFQTDCKNNTNYFLTTQKLANRDVMSGLSCLGVTDNELRYILPGE